MINVVLYEPEIPQNTGNIIRSCMAMNARLHLIEPLGFYMDEAKKQLRFDATISFDVDHQQTMDKLQNSIEAAFPDYTVSITGDIDTAD